MAATVDTVDTDLEEQSIVDPQLVVAETGNKSKPYQVTAVASTMLAVCRDLGQAGENSTRAALAREIDRLYTGANPESDHETPIIVEVSNKNWTSIQEAANRLSLEVEEGEYTPVDPPTPRSASGSKVRACECGCGTLTRGGRFLPGHDSKMKSRLITRVDQDADREAAAQLVQRGWWSQSMADSRLTKAERQNEPTETDKTEEQGSNS